MAVPGNFTSWPLILKHTELHRGHGFRSITLFLSTVFVPTFSWKRSSRKETKIESGYRSPRLLWTRTNKESTGSNVPTTRRHQNLNDFHSVQSHPRRTCTRRRRYFSLSFFLLSSVKIVLWSSHDFRVEFLFKNRIDILDLFIEKNDYFF